MLRQGDQRAHADTQQTDGRRTPGTIGRVKVGCTYRDCAPTPVDQPDDHVSRPASRTLLGKSKSLTKQRMMRVGDRNVRHQPIEDGGTLRSSAIQLSATPYWTALFITPIGSNSTAPQCANSRPMRKLTRRCRWPRPQPIAKSTRRDGRERIVVRPRSLRRRRICKGGYFPVTRSNDGIAGQVATWLHRAWLPFKLHRLGGRARLPTRVA
jgi:hypothetical protein